MRSDMAKVVTERSRVRSAARSRKFAVRLRHAEVEMARDDEGDVTPTRARRIEPRLRAGFVPWSRLRNRACKEFTDVLAPLRGYLRKQVGRPWDRVWSELCATLDRRSLTGLHIFQHIEWEVDTKCWLNARGEVMESRRFYSSNAPSRPVEGLYVHPRTGLLCAAPRRRRARCGDAWMRQREMRLRYPDVTIDEHMKSWQDNLLVRVNGAWFLREYVTHQPDDLIDVREWNRERQQYVVTRRTRAQAKAPLRECVNVRQLGKRELKALRRAGAL